MILEITLLLLLILIEAPLVGDERARCECDCSCGSKYHLSAGYPEGKGQGGGIDGIEENGQGTDDVGVEQGEGEEPVFVGGDDGQSSSTSERSLAVNVNSRDYLCSYSNRPRPPHLDRSAPDRKSPYLLTTGRKRKDEYWCAPCQKSFVDSVAIQQHQVARHSATMTNMPSNRKQITQSIRPTTPQIGGPSVICEVCSEELSNITALEMHKANLHPWSIFCPECLTSFRHASEAQMHYKSIHKAQSIDPHRMNTMLGIINGNPLPNPAQQLHPGLAPFTPQPYYPSQYVQTFPTHTIQSYYECTECNMVFGNPGELEAHKATPLVHGARISPSHSPSRSPSVSASASASTSDIAIAEMPLTVWGMPSFTFDEKKSESLKEEGWTPQARLTPEPDSTSISSEEDKAISVVLDEKKNVEELRENVANSEEPGKTDVLQVSDVIASAAQQGEVGDFGPAEVMELAKWIPLNPGPEEQSTQSEAVTLDDTPPAEGSTSTNEAIVIDDAPPPQETIISNDVVTTNHTSHQAVAEDPPGHTARAPIAKVLTSLTTISPRPIIQPVPSQINLTPYARAALASASRLGEYPPPEMDDEDEDTQDDQPKVIGGIECHIPSFALTISPKNKSTSLASASAPLSIEATPPLTLSGDSPSSSSLDESLVLEETDDPWAASQEVYEITHSQKRQTFSLDFGATSNGNRPKPRSHVEGGGTARSSRSKRGERSCNKRKETYLTPSQREVYRRNDSRSSNSASSRSNDRDTRSKAPPQAPLQPMFESEWSTVTPPSTSNRSMGGRAVRYDPWEASRREMEERRRVVSAGAGPGEEDMYGGW
ncbi:hypothetical protein I302_103729 [Kwoniella bestiolae CBS 10118]|uniref:C2H2-type domain-containing protein n=1 Tax=Kwoniella bestiolae CBS 10118 TaxID=1296100 RepID=A0AAJ8M7I1_9TREE